MNKPDLLETIQREGFTPIKRGGRYWLVCPFHNDKKPSLVIDAERGLWFCHGCQTGGDVITFIQRLYNFSFREAVSYLNLELKSSFKAKPKLEAQAKAKLEIELKAAFTEWVDARIGWLRETINGIYQIVSLIKDEASFERLGVLYHNLSLLEYELEVLLHGTLEEKLKFAQKDPKWRLISSWLITKYRSKKWQETF